MTPYIYPGLPEKEQFIIGNKSQFERSKEIIHVVCNTLMIAPRDFIGNCRNRELTEARQIAIGLIKVEEELVIALEKIGLLIGGRDHSTIIYSINSYKDLIETNTRFKNKVKTIKSILYGTERNKSGKGTPGI